MAKGLEGGKEFRAVSRSRRGLGFRRWLWSGKGWGCRKGSWGSGRGLV